MRFTRFATSAIHSSGQRDRDRLGDVEAHERQADALEAHVVADDRDERRGP
jgi:hypothetical protein